MVKTLEKQYQILVNSLHGQVTFTTDDVVALFSDVKRSSVNWMLSKMTENGYITRVRKGIYAFKEAIDEEIILSETAEKIDDILQESGFLYFISGTDILAKYMHHIPERYPIVLFVEKNAREEIMQTLRGEGIFVIESGRFRELYPDIVYTSGDRTIVILYVTDNFEYAKGGLAIKEKAFVDLFYAISRNGYPIALQELARIYQNMIRTGVIDKKRMIAAASRRNLQHDIRLIVDAGLITDEAFELAEILRSKT